MRVAGAIAALVLTAAGCSQDKSADRLVCDAAGRATSAATSLDWRDAADEVMTITDLVPQVERDHLRDLALATAGDWPAFDAGGQEAFTAAIGNLHDLDSECIRLGLT